MIITLLRTVILYILIIVGIRLLGKRQIGELEPTEFVLALLISDLAAVPMQDNGIPLLSGIIPIIVLLCLSMSMSVLMVRSVRFRALLCGVPSIVIKQGKLQQQELSRNRLTLDELMEELRAKGYTDLSTIQYAILETSGQLSVIPNASEKPVTVAQMQIPIEEPGLPVILISDGRLIACNLKNRGYEEGWLKKQLEHYGVHQIQDVFLLTVDEQGNTYFAAKEECS